MSNLKSISEEVEASRDRLTQTLGDLSDTVDPQAVSQGMMQTANTVSTDLAEKGWNLLRENPAGGLLAAIGVALMASGPRPRPAISPEPVLQPAEEAMQGFDDRVAAADAELKADMTGRYQDMPSASRLRKTLDAGLDQLPKPAKRRVVAARKSALAAQEAVEKRAKRVARQTSGFIHEQPLTAGAIALGFGVLAGTLLPRTRREDAALGAQRDALMADARDVLEEELLKAKARGEELLSANRSQPENAALHS
ncbi:DUF3619 family protein [Yoonia sp. R2331]|uniref:DUF3619 family protein n=1 Tax=Yoonia sp. R2331 TaxID=3237238 RepID=UPI0034E506CA